MKKLLLTLSLPILWMACNKEPKEASKSEQLRKGNWKVSSYKLKFYDSSAKKDSVEDVMEKYMPACVKDNRMQFLTNYEGNLLLQGEKCSGGEYDNQKFEWELVNNETGLNLYDVGPVLMQQNLRTEILRWEDGNVYVRYQEVHVLNDQRGDTTIFSIQLTRN